MRLLGWTWARISDAGTLAWLYALGGSAVITALASLTDAFSGGWRGVFLGGVAVLAILTTLLLADGLLRRRDTRAQNASAAAGRTGIKLTGSTLTGGTVRIRNQGASIEATDSMVDAGDLDIE